MPKTARLWLFVAIVALAVALNAIAEKKAE